jgi:hypothetical protein
MSWQLMYIMGQRVDGALCEYQMRMDLLLQPECRRGRYNALIATMSTLLRMPKTQRLARIPSRVTVVSIGLCNDRMRMSAVMTECS